MSPGDAIARAVTSLRAQRWGLAVVVIDGADVEHHLEAGDDPLTETSVFQIGSVTKTVTGLLLAQSILAGRLSLDDTLADLLGEDAGRCAHLTVGQLATHRGGLPRIPPNLFGDRADHRDPYGHYSADDLLEALALVDEPKSSGYLYSNFGFLILDLVLTRSAGRSYPEMFITDVAEPLGLNEAGCPPPETGRVPGYSGSHETPWWTAHLPAAGHIGMSIRDLGTYLRSMLEPSTTSLDEAIQLATTAHAGPADVTGLAWVEMADGSWIHDGGTGGFTSFAAFHRESSTAVGLLANASGLNDLNPTGVETMRQLRDGRPATPSA